MQSLYSPVAHGFIVQLPHRQYHEAETFPTLLVAIHLNPEYYETRSDKSTN